LFSTVGLGAQVVLLELKVLAGVGIVEDSDP